MGQRELPEMLSCLSAATKPARASEDFPLPDAPTMEKKAINRLTFGGRPHFVQNPLDEGFAATPEARDYPLTGIGVLARLDRENVPKQEAIWPRSGERILRVSLALVALNGSCVRVAL